MDFSPGAKADSRPDADLEPELHEGDGRVPGWVWWIVGAIIVFAALFAPFQLYWPIGG